jgi:TolB-like protein/Tfp pilus assembly protein PilF
MRRLATIMFTDIQGYTKLMQRSEQKAVDVRQRHRDIFEPSTLKFNGEIIQYYGDGTLSIFNNCEDAVNCAIEMQKAFQVSPSIPVRIGIHFGDILINKNDIIGDSVNVASRVESLGVAGSIMLSEKVKNAIEYNKYTLKSYGEFHFKNVDIPMEVFAIDIPGIVVPKKEELTGKLEVKKSKFFKPQFLAPIFLIILLGSIYLTKKIISPNIDVDWIAVLPFENNIPDSNQSHLALGIHDELISELLQSGISVRPHTSMKQYFDSDKTPKEIAKELNVDALVESSLHLEQDKIKIQVQLVSGTTNEYIMDPFVYKANMSNIMSLYSNVVKSIANTIKLSLNEDVKDRLESVVEINPQAYDFYLQGLIQADIGTEIATDQAIVLFKRALELEPNFGRAYSGLVGSILLQGFGDTPLESGAQFQENVEKAKKLDPAFANDHHQMAMVKIFSEWDWNGAAEELKKAIEKDPDSWGPYDSYCQLMWAMGRNEESVEAGKMAVEKDPGAHFARCDLAFAYYYNGQIEEAKKELLETIRRHQDDCSFHTSLRVIFELKEANGNKTIIRRIIKELNERKNKYPSDHEILSKNLGIAYAMIGEDEKAREIAEEIGVNAATIYAELGDKDMAFYILERAYWQRSFWLIYIMKSAPWLDPLRDDPRFDELLEKMGLLDDQLNRTQEEVI